MRPTLSGLLVLILLLFSILSSYSQCGVEAGNETSIICGGNVQFLAEPKWELLNYQSYCVFYSVHFTSPDTGYAVGTSQLGGLIIKTINGGKTWTIQNSGTGLGIYLMDVYFTGKNTGYIVGSDGIILKTSDGGDHWSLKNSGSWVWLKSVYFVDDSTGYVVGDNGATIQTIDGGETWTNISITSNYLNHIHFIDYSNGYAVGNGGTIIKTTDGGSNWTFLNSGTSLTLNSICFTDLNTGYAVGGDPGSKSIILKTDDSGSTWISLEIENINPLNSVFFTSRDTGYVVGGGNFEFGGVIFRTTDGGISWIKQFNESPYHFSNVHFPDNFTGYTVGRNFINYQGSILKLSLSGNTYSWSPTEGLTDPGIPNPVANPISSTRYTVTMTQQGGCISTDTLNVLVNPLMVTAGNDTTGTCMGKVKLRTTTNYSGSDPLIYSWIPAEGLDSTNISAPVATIDGNRTYTVSVLTQNGCQATDTVSVSLRPMDPPEICYVGVYGSNKNIIVWDQPVYAAIDSFYVYRETHQTGIYEKIGTVAYGGQGVFADTASHPEIQSNKYTLSIKDSCGLESPASTSHKTIHLTINQGQGNTWNLIWEPYEGFPVTTYYIYRGTNPENMVVIGSTSGISTQYSDFKAPTGYVYYMVEVVTPNPCYETKSFPSVSQSNIATNNPYFGIDNKAGLELSFTILPNPVNDYMIVEFPKFFSKDNPVLEIITIDGRLIRSIRIDRAVTQIDVSDLPAGVYISRLIQQGGAGVRRLVKK